MAKLYTGARMTTATTGTGTITLGAAVSGYLTFAGAGVANGDVVAYGIKDGANSEWGSGTYTSSGTTLSRTLTLSTTGSLLNLSGAAEVYITPRKEDLLSITETQTANTLLCGPSSGGAAVPTFRGLVAADVPALAYVTSVSLSLPAFITVSGSPVTASGTLTGALANQNANLHFCGPSSGGAAAPAFRALVAADIPGNATGLTFLGTLTASNSASLDDTVDITSTYDEYMIVLRNVIPATTNAALLMRISTDGGATYAATTYDTMITGAFASGGAGGSGSGERIDASQFL